MSEQLPGDRDDGPSGPTGPPTRRELLAIEVDATGPSVLVAVAGELDELTAPDLLARVQQAIRPDCTLAIDLGGLTFCGSAGLSALIIIERCTAEAGGSLVITRPSPFVVDLLEMAGLDGLVGDQPGP